MDTTSASSNPAASRAWLERVGFSRGVLLLVGLACVALGVVAILLPLVFLEYTAWALGGLLIVSGAVKAVQFALRGRSERGRDRGWPAVLAQVVLDLGLGVLLITRQSWSLVFFRVAFGALFLSEGVVYFLMGARGPTFRSRALLWLGALAMGALGLAVIFGLVEQPITWAGALIGAKLCLFGLMLLIVAATSSSGDARHLYDPVVVEPVPAELYAVYFGTAFHLGVCVAPGEIVHYLNDNHVYHVTWEQFLAGRVPQHWTYPDLPLVPTETVIQTALSEVGKTYPYHLLTYNCENFAIFCKSGGTTTTSQFAQVGASLAGVKAHPVRGMIAEWNTRTVEWLAFHLGGPAGKRLSLSIRRIGSAITAWLTSGGVKHE